LRFLIHPYEGFSAGLFLEHRDNRARVMRLAKDRSVLNLFSYTCGFSVAALSGGAATVDSVDVSRRYLEWGKRNLQMNALDPVKGRFFCSDTIAFYKRAERQGRRYDLIIIDPPTFSKMRRPSRVFVLNEALERLIAGAVQLLKSGGLILLSLNDRQIRMDRMADALLQAGPGRRPRIVERPPLPLDFQGDPDFSKTLIAQFD
ncbi:MAG TPA: class I SAM-dependent methyltransferase, partial [Phycisphaerae bacterium]|nr:class I SAM-dependent methyltransferase [Phycisphaerae bacterium]